METLHVNGKTYTIIAADDPVKGKGTRLRDGDTDEELAAIFIHGNNISFYGMHTAIPLSVLQQLIACFNEKVVDETQAPSNQEETIGIP